MVIRGIFAHEVSDAMADHYYTRTPQAGHDRQTYDVAVKGMTLQFVTDAGVFSKHGLDYGSRLLIEHMTVPEEARVLDVGCGYGPIGLFAAAMTKSAVVTMVDVNERAVALANENARLNRLDHVRILQSDLFSELRDETFDMIVTNPPIRAGKQIVHQIYEESCARLVAGGSLWIVIQKKQGAASTLRKLQTLFTKVIEVTKAKGYRIYQAIK